MKFFIFCFIILNSNILSQEQDSITVFTARPESKFIQFELEFFNKIIEVYNNRSKNKFSIKMKILPKFINVYEKIRENYGNNLNIIGINTSTIYSSETYDKYYTFSEPFLPVKTAIIGSENYNFERNIGFTLTVVNTTEYLAYVSRLKEASYHFKVDFVKSYDQMYHRVIGKYSNAYLGDTIDAWLNEDLKIVYEVDKVPYYFGYLYQNSSTLRKKLDPIIKYLRKSPIYYNLLKKYFGESFKTYYQNTMLIQ
jgi:hypothetical protein